MDIYEPREDSYQLKEEVVKHAEGKVLDMGTGSGIQGLAAASRPGVSEVLLVDINPEAIAILQRKIRDEGLKHVKAIESDLFSNICANQKFDTIIFNPPYLPEEESDDDIALYGGKEGWEIPVRFLKEAKSHLNENGRILFLFSSLTNKDKIDSTIEEMGMESELLSERSFFFERLYVYRIY